MNRVVLQACLPWLVVLAVLVAAAALLVRLGGSRLRLARLIHLHADQDGGAQSLSFVLTLPLFFVIVLAIIDVSQVTIGTMVVNYAAFAAARAAIVWIPATTAAEAANCMIGLDNSSVTGDAPVATGGIVYPDPNIPQSFLGSAKYDKIRLAAAMACTPICPSVGLNLTTADNTLSLQTTASSVTSAQNAYLSLTSAQVNPQAATRLQNKIAYALASVPVNSNGQSIQNPDGSPGLMTWVGLQVFHPSIEPPLVAPAWPAVITNVGPNYLSYFQSNEIGWRDAVTVTVQHRMAIMVMVPGAGNVLSKFFNNGLELVTLPGSATKVCVLPITASATLGVEGEKSQAPYVYSTSTQ